MADLASQTIENVPVKKLKPHPENPRQGDIGAISESLEAHGFYGVIVAQRSTGHVLAGNHRLMAARASGITQVPVAWMDVDDDEALRILLVDNRTNDLATYDDNVLADLLTRLAQGPGLTGTGYTGDDLDDLLAALAAAPELQRGTAEPSEEDYWPELRLKIHPDAFVRWTALVTEAGDERGAFMAMLDLT